MEKKILFIGGGNMAEGIIRGALNEKVMTPDQIFVSEIVPSRQEYLKDTYGLTIVDDINETAKTADMILLAVRPQDAENVVVSMSQHLKDQIFISIVAGIDVNRLTGWTHEDAKIARVMPNVLIEAKHGYSAVCASKAITKEDQSTISQLFNAIGQTMFIDERLFNEFTAFSCAGPAYIMYFMAAMIDAGVESGFSRIDSTNMVIENMIGSGKMLQLTNKIPYEITNSMTSPAGVTIEGLHVLSRTGFNGIVMDAVRAAVNRSNEF